jgi:tetratricopeptide (TPR) repeat protein
MSETNNNPYITGTPVGNTTAFIGRENILNAVSEVLEDPQRNAIVLYGQRRIGKTSVLQALENQLSKKDAYHIVNFSLEGKDTLPLTHLLHSLAQYISGVVKPEGLNAIENIKETFKQWLAAWFNQLPDKTTTLVLLIDEFDSILKSKTTTAFFPYLRELLAEYSRFNCVFVIGRDIEDLSSRALAQFQPIPMEKISLLSPKQTEQLVTLSDSETNKSLKWSFEAINEVKKLTNGHPFLTQSLCSQIWQLVCKHQPEKQELPTVTWEQVEQAIPKTLASDFNNWEYVWNGLPAAGKVIVSALAEEKGEANLDTLLNHILTRESIAVIMRELREVPGLLQDWDLIEPVGVNYRFRVELICRWVQTYKPLDEVQTELDTIKPAAETLYQTGKKLYDDKHREEAISTLRQVINSNPSHIKANRLLADILAHQRKLNEARDVLENFSKHNSRAASSQLIIVLLALAEKSERDEEKLKYYDRVLELDKNHSEAKKLKQEIEQRREAKRRRPIELLKNFVITYAKRISQVIGFAVILVIFYFLAKNFPTTILLEIEQADDQSRYSLVGVPSSENYLLDSLQIIILNSSQPKKPPTFEYKHYQPIKLAVVPQTRTPTYQINSELLQQLPINEFEYPSSTNKPLHFVFDFQFAEKSSSKVDFACQAATTDQTPVECQVKQIGYGSLLRGIPWWQIGTILGVIFIMLIEFIFAWKNRERDDEF